MFDGDGDGNGSAFVMAFGYNQERRQRRLFAFLKRQKYLIANNCKQLQIIGKYSHNRATL